VSDVRGREHLTEYEQRTERKVTGQPSYVLAGVTVAEIGVLLDEVSRLRSIVSRMERLMGLEPGSLVQNLDKVSPPREVPSAPSTLARDCFYGERAPCGRCAVCGVLVDGVSRCGQMVAKEAR
jgi:hypothetical protein